MLRKAVEFKTNEIKQHHFIKKPTLMTIIIISTLKKFGLF